MRKNNTTKKTNPGATYFGEVLTSVCPKPMQNRKQSKKHEKQIKPKKQSWGNLLWRSLDHIFPKPMQNQKKQKKHEKNI